MKKGVYLIIFLVFVLSLSIMTNTTAIFVIREGITGKIITGETVIGGVVTGKTVTGETITGEATSPVAMNISVTGPVIPHITIASPENTTYNFNIVDDYIIDLNVSANFEVNTWWYDLLDLENNITINSSVIFTPNTTINAVNGSNKLLVYANDSSGDIANSNVTFYVNVITNVAPVIEHIDSEIYICEGNYLSYYFNATDSNGDVLTSDISPKNPFYVFPVLSLGETLTKFEIISGTLSKSHAGGVNAGSKTYEETVSVSDPGGLSDSKQTNMTVIEINNAPNMGNIGVQTVQTQGENNTFYKQVQVADIEDGNQDSGNLIFNITILNSTGNNVNLFNISSNGVMNYTGNESHIGVYNISVCVTDNEIENPHPGIIGNCSQDGSAIQSCKNFSLTVTDENRQPTIINYYPINLSFNVSGTDGLLFNITTYDPDQTPIDIYWYVDGVKKKFVSGIDDGSSVDEFTYTFGCEVSGSHTVKAEITDGLLNDFVQWNIDVIYVGCPVDIPRGGGLGMPGCPEKWVCGDWVVCQNAEKSLEEGIVSGENYRTIKDYCLKNNWDEKFCGLQIKNCFDLNYCNATFKKPEEIQVCFYTEKPSCDDGIKNCHHGACEFLVDCGGPCPPCPTCSDEIQNQGEEGIDCGGPCPWPCPIEEELPTIKKSYVKYTLIILLMLSIIIIAIKLISIFKIKKKIKRAN